MSNENGSPAPKMLWWEKTVEYAFVRQILPNEYQAAPLAGDAEKFFGDLMNENGNGQARLIEFKRTAGNIQDEVKKYYPLNKVPDKQTFHKAWLEALDGKEYEGSQGHWFVYGSLNEKTSELVLSACQYGPEAAEGFEVIGDDQLGYVKPKALADYMEQLLVTRTRGGGWSGVMVVGKLNGKTLLMNPQEFIDRKMELELVAKLSARSSYTPSRTF